MPLETDPSPREVVRPALTQTATSGSRVTSSSSLIHVGASMSTTAEASSRSSTPSSHQSTFVGPSHSTVTVAESGDPIYAALAEDDVVAEPGDHDALDLLYRVNTKAAQRAAMSAPGSLRSRFSQLSVQRTNTAESLGLATFQPPPAEHDDDRDDTHPDRKYYILSSAGKPIYVSNANRATEEEDESSTTQVGVMQALISIFVDEDSDKLRYLRRGKLLIVFLLRAPLYLVCVSEWADEPSTLRQHLEYLHLQVIGLVSASQLSRLFGRMPNFDLRRLIQGTEGIFDHLVTQFNANHMADQTTTDWAVCHQWSLQALQPIRITVPTLRDLLTAALQPPSASTLLHTGPQRPKDLLYILLIANGRIVTLLRPKKHSVHPTDLLLLINTVCGSKSIQRSGGQEEAEIWLPFSMPKFAPQGFVHAYIKFLDPNSWVPPIAKVAAGPELAVVVVTADKDSFPVVSEWIGSLLMPSPKMSPFQTHITSLYGHLAANFGGAYTCAEIGLAGLRHFVYRSNSSIQITSPTLPDPYAHRAEDRKRLFTLYALLHHNIHHPEPPAGAPDTRLKMQLLKTPNEQVLGWITVPFELYLCVNPSLSKSSIVGIANALTKWIKHNDKHLFLLSAGTF